MNLAETCWTVIGRGPRGIPLLFCTRHGLLDTFLRYDDAVEEAKAHRAENSEARP